MMYRLILNQNCDLVELIPHLLLIGNVLLPQLHKNDAVREEERDLSAEDVESIPSDHNYDS